jgi:hypothetical protein
MTLATGAEDLLARDAHGVGGRFGEQRRLQVEAGRVAVQPLAAEGELGAFPWPIWM